MRAEIDRDGGLDELWAEWEAMEYSESPLKSRPPRPRMLPRDLKPGDNDDEETRGYGFRDPSEGERFPEPPPVPRRS